MIAAALMGIVGAPVVQTTDPDTRLRTGPGEQFNRLAVVPAGISLSCVGKTGDWYHVQLCPTLDAWVYKTTVTEKPQAGPLAQARITDITSSPTPDGVRITFALTRPVAFRILPELYPPRLELDLFDCVPSTYWVRQKAGDHVTKTIVPWMMATDWTRVSIALNMPAIVGYTASYPDTNLLALDIRSAMPPGGLTGRKIVLDPGHGGKDDGATGPDGILEKTVNLAIATRTAELLRAAGATVILTRTGDNQVGPPGCSAADELEARVQVGVKNDAALFISIHNNSAGDKPNGDVSGTEAYYWTPFSQPLARALMESVSGALGVPPRHVALRPLHVLRSTDCPRALVECAYMSNPAEEKKMDKRNFVEAAAEGIVAGIRRYLDWASGVTKTL